jgi:hypothetical protein
MASRSQCVVDIKVHVSRLILVVAHLRRWPRGVGPQARGRVVRGVVVM